MLQSRDRSGLYERLRLHVESLILQEVCIYRAPVPILLSAVPGESPLFW